VLFYAKITPKKRNGGKGRRNRRGRRRRGKEVERSKGEV